MNDHPSHPTVKTDLAHTAQLLINAMNDSPFVKHIGLVFYYQDGKIIGTIDNQEALIGNPNFRILHGGVAATVLDTIGGLVGMYAIFEQGSNQEASGDTLEEKTKKVKRMATVDLRIDYLSPGRGKQFIATAEVIRMGRKGCTTTMLLTNEEGVKIAHGIASYAF